MMMTVVPSWEEEDPVIDEIARINSCGGARSRLPTVIDLWLANSSDEEDEEEPTWLTDFKQKQEENKSKKLNDGQQTTPWLPLGELIMDRRLSDKKGKRDHLGRLLPDVSSSSPTEKEGGSGGDKPTAPRERRNIRRTRSRSLTSLGPSKHERDDHQFIVEDQFEFEDEGEERWVAFLQQEHQQEDHEQQQRKSISPRSKKQRVKSLVGGGGLHRKLYEMVLDDPDNDDDDQEGSGDKSAKGDSVVITQPGSIHSRSISADHPGGGIPKPNANSNSRAVSLGSGGRREPSKGQESPQQEGRAPRRGRRRGSTMSRSSRKEAVVENANDDESYYDWAKESLSLSKSLSALKHRAAATPAHHQGGSGSQSVMSSWGNQSVASMSISAQTTQTAAPTVGRLRRSRSKSLTSMRTPREGRKRTQKSNRSGMDMRAANPNKMDMRPATKRGTGSQRNRSPMRDSIYSKSSTASGNSKGSNHSQGSNGSHGSKGSKGHRKSSGRGQSSKSPLPPTTSRSKKQDSKQCRGGVEDLAGAGAHMSVTATKPAAALVSASASAAAAANSAANAAALAVALVPSVEKNSGELSAKEIAEIQAIVRAAEAAAASAAAAQALVAKFSIRSPPEGGVDDSNDGSTDPTVTMDSSEEDEPDPTMPPLRRMSTSSL